VSSFWQIGLDKESRPVSAYTSPGRGQFQWTRMMMGAKGSSASFSRLMDIVMDKAEGVLCYIDDTLVFSKNLDQHMVDLETALSRLQRYGLELNAKKCSFNMDNLPFLGFRLGKDGIRADFDKVMAVWEYPPPRTIKQLREFLGLTNFYRAFIDHYSLLSGHLSNLLPKSENWEEGTLPDKAMSAFVKLKHALCREPVLAYARPNVPFILATDASARRDPMVKNTLWLTALGH
jgi:hypothetical protein